MTANRPLLDRLDDAVADAIGRVIARIELHDEAIAERQPDLAAVHLQALVERCRDLKKASNARSVALGNKP